MAATNDQVEFTFTCEPQALDIIWALTDYWAGQASGLDVLNIHYISLASSM